jgi:hypothetical protein
MSHRSPGEEYSRTLLCEGAGYCGADLTSRTEDDGYLVLQP